MLHLYFHNLSFNNKEFIDCDEREQIKSLKRFYIDMRVHSVVDNSNPVIDHNILAGESWKKKNKDIFNFITMDIHVCVNFAIQFSIQLMQVKNSKCL